jgi:hypothetical protein
MKESQLNFEYSKINLKIILFNLIKKKNKKIT